MKKAILIAGAVVFCLVLGLAGLSFFLRYKSGEPLSRPPLHGVSFLIEAPADQATNDFAVLKAVLLKRGERAEVKVYWEPVSDRQARVMIAAGFSEDIARLQQALFRPGRVEFRLVHDDTTRLLQAGETPPGYEKLKRELRMPSRAGQVEWVVVKRKAERELSGNVIKRAAVTRGNLGEPEIYFTMHPKPAEMFGIVTRENIGRRLAIVIDGELYSAPTIQTPIESGSGMITGHFGLQEAVQLAGVLDCPLPFPVKVVESKQF